MRVGGVTAGLCALAVAGAGATASTAKTKPPPATAAPDLAPAPDRYPKVAITSDIPVVMSDGKRLYADVIRPADASGKPAPGRFPVILSQTPYSTYSTRFAPPGTLQFLASRSDFLVRHGYVQVFAQVRGTGESEGDWEIFGEREQLDSGELARWAVGQPFSDGRLALYGASYLGINQFFTAAQRPPGLRALFAVVPGEDIYRDVVVHGGEINAGFIPFEVAIVTFLKMLPPGYTGPQFGRAVGTLFGHLYPGAATSLEASLSGLLGGQAEFDGPFWRLRAPRSVVDRVRAPTFIVGGWYDLFQRGEPRLYNALPLRPGRKQLLMGPWYHTTAGTGLGTRGTPPALDTLALAWFDRWVKGVRNGVERFGPVTLNELGTANWTTHRAFPPPSVRYRRLYLSGAKSGTARSAQDGSLVEAPPASKFAHTGQVNPAGGVCTRSTVQWSAALVPPVQPCETDNRLQELTAFTYTTARQQRPLHLSGPVGLTLQGETNAGDAIWTAVLTDVAPDGKSTQITGGWLLSSRRAIDSARTTRAPNGDLVAPYHPYTKASLLPVYPREMHTLNIEIFNTDAVIKPRHRLRLVITSGDVPHLAPMGYSLFETFGAVTTVRSSPAARSFLTLPVLDDSLARQPKPAKRHKRHRHREHH